MKEKILKKVVVVFLIKNEKICLPVKKEKIGAGFRNGYGGGIEEDESPKQAAVRESLEEGKIEPLKERLNRVALLRCENTTDTGETFTCIVHVFVTKFWVGIPKETKEMGVPTWFPIDSLPLNELMLADRVWLPRLLKDKKPLVVEAQYGPHQEALLGEVQIEEFAVLPEE